MGAADARRTAYPAADPVRAGDGTRARRQQRGNALARLPRSRRAGPERAARRDLPRHLGARPRVLHRYPISPAPRSALAIGKASSAGATAVMVAVASRMVKYAWTEENRDQFPASRMCRGLACRAAATRSGAREHRAIACWSTRSWTRSMPMSSLVLANPRRRSASASHSPDGRFGVVPATCVPAADACAESAVFQHPTLLHSRACVKTGQGYRVGERVRDPTVQASLMRVWILVPNVSVL